MNVGDLKKILNDVPDETPLGAYDEGCFTEEVCPGLGYFAPVPGRGTILRQIHEHSGHPSGVTAKLFFILQ